MYRARSPFFFTVYGTRLIIHNQTWYLRLWNPELWFLVPFVMDSSDQRSGYIP
jgi:hypothetical protein